MKIIRSKNSISKLKEKLERVKEKIEEKTKETYFSEICPGDVFANGINGRYYIKINSNIKNAGVDLFNGKEELFLNEDRVISLNTELVEK
jgi:hypothetical protein